MTGYRARFGWLAGAALMSLALLGPSSAMATGSHHLQMYKVEKHVTMDGDFDQITLACHDGDYALDGMWRVDHVDQDNEFAGNVLTTVDVYDSYSDSHDPALWHFAFAKASPGDAQLKVFLTCLGNISAPNTHQHEWLMETGDVSGPFDYGWHGTSSGVGVPGAVGGVEQYTTVPYPATTWVPAGTPNGTPSCPSGYLLVAPGFHVTYGDAENPLRLVGSYPIGTYGHRQSTWQWRFGAMYGPNTVDLNYRCLRIRSTTEFGHSHKLVYRLRYGASLILPANKVTEKKVECAEHYKGMVGGFWFGSSHEKYLWWLGMDPRPKERAYRILNMDPLNAHQVDLSLLCFNDRTS